MTILAIGIGLVLGWVPYYIGLRQGISMTVNLTKDAIQKEIDKSHSR